MTSKERYQVWYQRNISTARQRKTEQMRKYRANNPAKYATHSRKAKTKLKEKVFQVYGVICVRCGFSDIRALTLDHKKNNGAEERKSIGERGVYNRALNPMFRDEYQTLCMNCQFIKRVEASRQNQWLRSHGECSQDKQDTNDRIRNATPSAREMRRVKGACWNRLARLVACKDQST